MKRKLMDLLRSLFPKTDKKDRGEGKGNEPVDFIIHRIDIYLVEKKPFLKPRYTIKQLATEIRIPSYQISAVINHKKGIGFSDYINKLRVRHCEELIKIDRGRNVNIQKIASECGFHNRNTFTTAFKKFTGRTPSEYIKEYW